MKPGDLVKFKGPTEHHPEEKYGMFLGLKTFDGNYTRAEVMWYPENIVKPVQSDMLEAINESR